MLFVELLYVLKAGTSRYYDKLSNSCMLTTITTSIVIIVTTAFSNVLFPAIGSVTVTVTVTVTV